MKKVIFTDFDGTITKVDSCSAMVKAFAGEGWEEINKLWEDKKLSTAECAAETFRLFDATIDEISRLMNTIEIDAYFKEFLSFCRNKGYEVYILSDGYDFNIQTILNKYDVSIKFFANRLVYDKNKGFGIDCPYENKACGKCGTCKTDLIKKLKNEGDWVIYIGDSYSDMCPAAIADVVFAKGILFDFCKKKGINAVHFTNFQEIIERL